MRFRPALFSSAALALAITACDLFPGRLAAADQTEVKIRLMADALTARDHGDYATARGKLEALQAIAPNDPNVRRILADVIVRQTAPPPPPVRPPPSTPVVRVAPVVAGPPPPAAPLERPAVSAASGQVVMPVVHDERPEGAVTVPRETRSPEVVAAATAAEALLHADDTQLGKVMAYVQAQRALARTQARDGNYSAAIAALAAAQEELQRPVDELRAERRDYARRKRDDERAEERSRTGVRLRHQR